MVFLDPRKMVVCVILSLSLYHINIALMAQASNGGAPLAASSTGLAQH